MSCFILRYWLGIHLDELGVQLFIQSARFNQNWLISQILIKLSSIKVCGNSEVLELFYSEKRKNILRLMCDFVCNFVAKKQEMRTVLYKNHLPAYISHLFQANEFP